MSDLKTFYALFLIVILSFSGCATLNEAKSERYERKYIGNLENIKESATLAFASAGIEVEKIDWNENIRQYTIIGNVEVSASQARGLVNSRQGTISIGKVTMTLNYIEDGIVFTHIDTSTNQTHPMASSADRHNTLGQPEEDIYRYLDKRYERSIETN